MFRTTQMNVFFFFFFFPRAAAGISHLLSTLMVQLLIMISTSLLVMNFI